MHNIVHRKTNLSHTTTDYIGNFVFEGGEFKRYNFDDGYIFPYWKPETHTYSQGYNYYIKDHQGNIRMIVNNNGTVSQVNHLTAYGATIGNSYNQEFNKYKYNGKELDRMHGLDLYDYGARQYDPAIGSFTSMDPLAEKHYHINPYAYCAGNPVRYIDPDGRDWVKVYATGKYIYDKDLNGANFKTKYGHEKYRYMGKTAETPDGRYLSLFGHNMDARKKSTKLYQHIENCFISHEKAAKDMNFEESEDFHIGIPYKEDLWNDKKNIYKMEYEGADVLYTVMESDKFNAMNGYIESFMKKEEDKCFQGGIAINIKQKVGGSRGSTIVRINFLDPIKAQSFLDKYNKEFGTKITITQYEKPH